MRDALDRMAIAIEQGIVGMNADLEFHFAVARASGNEFFEAVMESMRTPLEFAVNLARSLSLKRPMDHLLTVQAEHVAMFEAIEAQRQGRRAARHAHAHRQCLLRASSKARTALPCQARPTLPAWTGRDR